MPKSNPRRPRSEHRPRRLDRILRVADHSGFRPGQPRRSSIQRQGDDPRSGDVRPHGMVARRFLLVALVRRAERGDVRNSDPPADRFGITSRGRASESLHAGCVQRARVVHGVRHPGRLRCRRWCQPASRAMRKVARRRRQVAIATASRRRTRTRRTHGTGRPGLASRPLQHGPDATGMPSPSSTASSGRSQVASPRIPKAAAHGTRRTSVRLGPRSKERRGQAVTRTA